MPYKGSGEEGVGGDVAASEEPEALRGRLREAEEAVAVREGGAAQLERQLAELRVDAEALRGRAGEAEGARAVVVEELETLKAYLGDAEGGGGGIADAVGRDGKRTHSCGCGGGGERGYVL